MKIIDGREVSLTGSHFLVNIALPEFDSSGIKVVNRDPRKARIKPSCYVGKIEEVGPRCSYAKVGDTVVFERWQWQQMDVDDERMVVREKDLIVFGESLPMPGVLVINLEDHETPRTTIALPSLNYTPKPRPYYCGVVERLPLNIDFIRVEGVEIRVGDKIYIEKYEVGQYRDGQGRLFFRIGSGADILAKIESNSAPEFSVI